MLCQEGGIARNYLVDLLFGDSGKDGRVRNKHAEKFTRNIGCVRRTGKDERNVMNCVLRDSKKM